MFNKKKQQVLKEERTIPQVKIDYPNGVFVVTEEGSYYYLKGNYKYLIKSIRVLESWRPPSIAPSSLKAIAHYTPAGSLGFRAGTLISNIADNKLYLISDNKRRHVQNPDWLDVLGFGLHDALIVSAEETGLHQEGDPLV